MDRESFLFSRNDWFSLERHLSEQLQKEIQAYPPERMLNTSPEALVKYFVDTYATSRLIIKPTMPESNRFLLRDIML